jgi:hypothetical protein
MRGHHVVQRFKHLRRCQVMDLDAVSHNDPDPQDFVGIPRAFYFYTGRLSRPQFRQPTIEAELPSQDAEH